VRDVCIIGIGQTPVGEHWYQSLRILGATAVHAALGEAQIERPEALFVGNMLSGQVCHQENLGALIADYAGLRGIEAVKVEAACASAAAALRQAYLWWWPAGLKR
jgi:acetyl-CoA C-acetyltransferase